MARPEPQSNTSAIIAEIHASTASQETTAIARSRRARAAGFRSKTRLVRQALIGDPDKMTWARLSSGVPRAPRSRFFCGCPTAVCGRGCQGNAGAGDWFQGAGPRAGKPQQTAPGCHRGGIGSGAAYRRRNIASATSATTRIIRAMAVCQSIEGGQRCSTTRDGDRRTRRWRESDTGRSVEADDRRRSVPDVATYSTATGDPRQTGAATPTTRPVRTSQAGPRHLACCCRGRREGGGVRRAWRRL
jgi:hypothetical protein